MCLKCGEAGAQPGRSHKHVISMIGMTLETPVVAETCVSENSCSVELKVALQVARRLPFAPTSKHHVLTGRRDRPLLSACRPMFCSGHQSSTTDKSHRRRRSTFPATLQARFDQTGSRQASPGLCVCVACVELQRNGGRDGGARAGRSRPGVAERG